MAKDLIITPASGKLDFYGTTGGSVLANINLTDNNDLSLSATSGNLIIGDASRDIYIGDGVNNVDIIFEQNGEIRPLATKTLTIGASGAFTSILATQVEVNGIGVSVSGHTHTSSNITDFNSSVSGLIPSTIVHTTGNQTIGGVKTFNDQVNVDNLRLDGNTISSTVDNIFITSQNSIGITSDDTIDIYTPTVNFEYDSAVEFYNTDNNQEVLYVGDKVGILKSNPATALDVNGTVTATTFSGAGTSLTGTAASLTVGAVISGVYTSRNINTTSPVTGGGNLSADRTIALATAYGDTLNPYGSKTANHFLAAPNGTTGVPSFRAIVAADIPTLNQNTTGNAGTVTNGVYTTGNQTIGGVKTFNNQVNVDNLRLDGNTLSSTNPNGNVVINPNGNGALQRDSGGNARGQYAVDFQTVRMTNDRVAGGNHSVICGGGHNRASGNYSVICGGQFNSAISTYAAIVGGNNNTSQADFGIITGGASNFIASQGSYATICGGVNNFINSARSIILGGSSSQTSLNGELAYSAGGFMGAYMTQRGSAQYSMFIARQMTTDSSQQLLLVEGSSFLSIPLETTWTFNIKLSAYSENTDQGAWWIFRGGIRRNSSNNTTLIGSIITENGAESSLTGATATVLADDTNDALHIRVTGVNGLTIKWVAVIDVSQVSGRPFWSGVGDSE